MTKLWGCGVPASVRDYYSLRLCLFIKIYCSLLPTHLFQSCYGSTFPPLYLTPIAPPYFTLWRRFALSLHPLLLPNSTGCRVTIHLDGAPTCRRPPLVWSSLHLWAPTRSSSREPMTAISCPISPPFPSSTCAQVPVSPRDYPVRGGFTLSACICCPHVWYPPPAVLNRRPSPLLVSRGLHHVLLSPAPCACTLLSSCSATSSARLPLFVCAWLG